MALDLKNLDDITRKHMVAEIQADIDAGGVYHSKFLTPVGVDEWDGILLQAAQSHDSSWLAEQLRNERLAVSTYRMVDRRGHARNVTLYPENLADSEFNRYYIRGLCLRALEEGIPYVISYRAKPVRQPKSPVGLQYPPEVLLEDLRTNKGQTENDVPSNPNSGISVRFP